jgi:hypothetical protein
MISQFRENNFAARRCDQFTHPAYNALLRAKNAGGTLGCKQRNHFRFLQSLQRHRSEFRQTEGINHFVQRTIMDGGGFRQNGAMNVN